MTDSSPLRFRLVTEDRKELVPFGHSPRLRKDFGTPEGHFLLYVRETEHGLDPRRMWDSRMTNITQSEAELFLLAKGPKPTGAYLGPGMSNMAWTHPCYFTIVLDNPGFRFQYNSDVNDPKGEPLVFLEEFFGMQYHRNFSFYNAEPVEVPVLNASGNPTGETRHGLRFQNHIKGDANGNSLKKGETRRYKFNMMVWKPQQGGPDILVATDPDGQNQGPGNVP